MNFEMPIKTTAEADPEKCKEFGRELKTWSNLDVKLAYIDNTRTLIRVEPTQVWFDRGAKQSLDLSSQSDWTGVFGAVSEDGEESQCQPDEYITGNQAGIFIQALIKEFDDDLIVVL